MKERKAMVEPESSELSIRRQCQLLSVNRTRLNSKQRVPNGTNMEICRWIDEIHLEAPAFGTRKIRDLLKLEHDFKISRWKVRKLMRFMGVEAIYRRPRTTLPGKGEEHKVYPYLLRDREVSAPDEVWCTDFTYLPMGRGFAYLAAVMDWNTRAVLSWKLSNTMETRFCLEAYDEAVKVAGRVPDIFNTDQGCQFTSKEWRKRLEGDGVKISMDGKGCWRDNVFIERLWRSVKYEEVYLNSYRDLAELEKALERWFGRYNFWRPHDALGGIRPWDAYRPAARAKIAA